MIIRLPTLDCASSIKTNQGNIRRTLIDLGDLAHLVENNTYSYSHLGSRDLTTSTKGIKNQLYEIS